MVLKIGGHQRRRCIFPRARLERLFQYLESQLEKKEKTSRKEWVGANWLMTVITGIEE